LGDGPAPARELLLYVDNVSLVELVSGYEHAAGFDVPGAYAGLVLDHHKFGDLTVRAHEFSYELGKLRRKRQRLPYVSGRVCTRVSTRGNLMNQQPIGLGSDRRHNRMHLDVRIGEDDRAVVVPS
jgi:hypothetical protein